MPDRIARADSWFAVLSALLAGLAVIAGAFGAHALRGQLDAAAMQTWHTAVEYHAAHALAMLIVALHAARIRFAMVACGLFVAGVALFSGSLYALALGAPRVVGFMTPFGGIAWIVAWGLVAYGLHTSTRSD